MADIIFQDLFSVPGGGWVPGHVPDISPAGIVWLDSPTFRDLQIAGEVPDNGAHGGPFSGVTYGNDTQTASIAPGPSAYSLATEIQLKNSFCSAQVSANFLPTGPESVAAALSISVAGQLGEFHLVTVTFNPATPVTLYQAVLPSPYPFSRSAAVSVNLETMEYVVLLESVPVAAGSLTDFGIAPYDYSAIDSVFYQAFAMTNLDRQDALIKSMYSQAAYPVSVLIQPVISPGVQVANFTQRINPFGV